MKNITWRDVGTFLATGTGLVIGGALLYLRIVAINRIAYNMDCGKGHSVVIDYFSPYMGEAVTCD